MPHLKKHRAIIADALPAMWLSGPKTAFKDVPVGSLVLIRFDDEIIEEGDPEFQLLIVYAQNKSTSTCAEPASMYRSGQATDITISHAEECVVLVPKPEPVPAPLIYYFVTVQSFTHNAKGAAKLLAVSEDQAKEMAAEMTIQNMQSFFDGPIRYPNPNAKQIDRASFLKGAIYTVEVLADQPVVIKSEWDKVK